MMSVSEIVLTVLTATGGSAVVLGALAAWLGKVWADRMAQTQRLLQDIDVDLRKRRIDAYQELWKSTALLPKWPKADGVTYERLLQFSEELRSWYFDKGGIYLSRSTHDDAYGPLQDALAELLGANKSGPISNEHYEVVRRLCSRLRGALAGDIESRREGPR
jgi:hypothetical protein